MLGGRRVRCDLRKSSKKCKSAKKLCRWSKTIKKNVPKDPENLLKNPQRDPENQREVLRRVPKIRLNPEDALKVPENQNPANHASNQENQN